jgi:stage V sporulation protein R
MVNKFMHGSPILLGDNTVPGVQLSKELKELAPKILQACRDWGLDFYPTVVQLLTYDEISEIAAYGGFPVRFPHWSFGMEYEELQRGYEFGMHKIYEMVINTNPCYIYCLSSNTLVDHLTVIAHATGHNDFFKNNIHFSATDTNMLNKMANHGTRIRKYMARWGKERVTEFLDYVMRLETLIDGAEAWTDRVVKEPVIRDEKKYRQPRRLKVDRERLYMEPFVNTREFRDQENKRIKKADLADELGVFRNPTKNILGFLRDNAPLKPWQADIVSMLYDEAIYFFPQRQTKVLNEGWASLTDSVIMAEQGFVALGQKSHDCGIVEYSEHKMGVLGSKYSMNPYKLGFSLLSDIRERWDKGRFGPEWDDCTDIRKKEKWDTGAKLGKEKVFEVRKYYDDLTFIHEFFTEDFCREQEYLHWKHYPNGEYKLESRDFKTIKSMLMRRHLNGGLPDIRLTEPNYRGKGSMFLQHEHDGRPLYEPYIMDVMVALRAVWGEDVYLATRGDNGEEQVYCCYGTDPDKDVEVVSRKEHLKRQ